MPSAIPVTFLAIEKCDFLFVSKKNDQRPVKYYMYAESRSLFKTFKISHLVHYLTFSKITSYRRSDSLTCDFSTSLNEVLQFR